MVWCYVLCSDMLWCDEIWCNVMCCVVMWCDVISCDVMCCVVIWCDVLWCYVKCCDVIWCDVMCCVVICCEVICCDVMWYGVMWCVVLWCDVPIVSHVLTERTYACYTSLRFGNSTDLRRWPNSTHAADSSVPSLITRVCACCIVSSRYQHL